MLQAALDPFSANYLAKSWDAYDPRAEKRDGRGVDTSVKAKILEPEEVEAAFAAYLGKDPKPTPEQAWTYDSYQACLTKTATDLEVAA